MVIVAMFLLKHGACCLTEVTWAPPERTSWRSLSPSACAVPGRAGLCVPPKDTQASSQRPKAWGKVPDVPARCCWNAKGVRSSGAAFPGPCSGQVSPRTEELLVSMRIAPASSTVLHRVGTANTERYWRMHRRECQLLDVVQKIRGRRETKRRRL